MADKSVNDSYLSRKHQLFFPYPLWKTEKGNRALFFLIYLSQLSLGVIHWGTKLQMYCTSMLSTDNVIEYKVFYDVGIYNTNMYLDMTIVSVEWLQYLLMHLEDFKL